MLPRNEFHVRVAWTSVAIGGEVAQFDERVTPEVGVERIFEHLLEPRLVEKVVSLFVLIAFGIDQFERLRHDESHPLTHTSREVKVYIHIAVYVVEPLAVRAIDIDGHLPGKSPVGNVPACERIGGALQFDDHLLHALAVGRLCQVEVSMRRVQYVSTSEHTAEKVLYVHSYQLNSLIVGCTRHSQNEFCLCSHLLTNYVVIVSVNRTIASRLLACRPRWWRGASPG